jgi:hypothetical protein
MEDLKPVENVYKGGFFKNRHRLSWRAPIVVHALINTFDLLSIKDAKIIDVGCAIGDYVKEFQDRGMDAHGIEGSPAAQEFFVAKNIAVKDLRKPIGFYGSSYDLAFSLEVAEHIDTMKAGIYCDNLCSLSDTILISAATPGQKGHGHVNCAPRKYWIDKFDRRGYINLKGVENTWRNNMGEWRTKKELSSYIKNAIIFKRRSAL